MRVIRPIRWPTTRPVLPRASSGTSGFFFCGMMDEPVVKRSAMSHKAKVLAHPQDQLFAQAADVHHAQAGGGGELDGKVAVAHGVQAVLADLRLALFVDHAQRARHPFAVQRVGGAGQRGAAQRQAVGAAAHVGQALGIAR